MDESLFLFTIFCGFLMLFALIWCFLSTCLGLPLRRSDLFSLSTYFPTPSSIRAREAERRRRRNGGNAGAGDGDEDGYELHYGQGEGYEMDSVSGSVGMGMGMGMGMTGVGGMGRPLAEEWEMKRGGVGGVRGTF